MTSEKITKRSYEDACGAAHALDLVGERWALLVIRELIFGPKRFSDLRADLPGISANVLTQRLEGLEQSGVLRRRKLPPPVSAQVYELTPWGYESEPIFQALGRWAARSPSHDPRLPLSATSLLMSFRTMVDRPRLEGLDARMAIDFGRERYLLQISPGGIDVERSQSLDAEAMLAGTPQAIAAVVYGGEPLSPLEDDGMLSVAGDRRLIERFLTLFPLPSKVAR